MADVNVNKKIQAASAESVAARAAHVESGKTTGVVNAVIKTASEEGKQNRIKVKGK